MPSDDKDTLVDRWIRALKNQKILASVIVIAIAVGGVTSFTESLSKLYKFWQASREQAAIAQFSDTKPDYAKHTLLWYPSLLYPELKTKVDALRKLAAQDGINLQYFETYRPPDVQHKMFSDTPQSTRADAWSSPKQYGLAATMWIYEGAGWASDPHDATAEKLALLASTVGLRQAGRTGMFLPWTYMLPTTKISDLKTGKYPARISDDARWADNINSQIASWNTNSPSAPPPVPSLR